MAALLLILPVAARIGRGGSIIEPTCDKFVIEPTCGASITEATCGGSSFEHVAALLLTLWQVPVVALYTCGGSIISSANCGGSILNSVTALFLNLPVAL